MYEKHFQDFLQFEWTHNKIIEYCANDEKEEGRDKGGGNILYHKVQNYDKMGLFLSTMKTEKRSRFHIWQFGGASLAVSNMKALDINTYTIEESDTSNPLLQSTRC